jgi:hypothetical protein
MIKCYFIDIKDISSDLPRSNFVESELEQLANLILETDGLIRPLIIKESGAEKYTVIEGHREYYAALKAKEQNSSKAEMVNAFVISEHIQSSAIEQLKIIKADISPVIPPAHTYTDIEKLLPTLIAAISQQMQPLVDQLAEQKKMLEALMIDRIALVDPQPIISPSTQQPESINITPTPIAPIVVLPKQPKAPRTPKVKVEKVKRETPKATTTKSTKVSILPESIDPINATNTLNLINTLSQDELILKMERSGVSKAAIKLVPDIITVRDSQPYRKFDTWKTVVALKIKGLGAKIVEGIIEKLK